MNEERQMWKLLKRVQPRCTQSQRRETRLAAAHLPTDRFVCRLTEGLSGFRAECRLFPPTSRFRSHLLFTRRQLFSSPSSLVTKTNAKVIAYRLTLAKCRKSLEKMRCSSKVSCNILTLGLHWEWRKLQISDTALDVKMLHCQPLPPHQEKKQSCQGDFWGWIKWGLESRQWRHRSCLHGAAFVIF